MTNLSSLRSRRDALGLGAMSGLGLALAGGAVRIDRVQAQSQSPRSAGPLRSAGVLAFGPDNVLFVGDITGSAIHAFVLRDGDLTPQTGVILGNFDNFEGVDLVRGLDVKLAALMGTSYDNIVINDMAVHEPTKQIILSVERGRGANVIPAIVKVNLGQLEVLNLDDVPHSSTLIPNSPTRTHGSNSNPSRSTRSPTSSITTGRSSLQGSRTNGLPRPCIAFRIPSVAINRQPPSKSGIRCTASSKPARRSSAISSGRSAASLSSLRYTDAHLWRASRSPP